MDKSNDFSHRSRRRTEMSLQVEKMEKNINLFLILMMLINLIMPTMVNAGSVNRIGNSKVKSVT
mgnify:CR=1 FL=1